MIGAQPSAIQYCLARESCRWSRTDRTAAGFNVSRHHAHIGHNSIDSTTCDVLLSNELRVSGPNWWRSLLTQFNDSNKKTDTLMNYLHPHTSLCRMHWANLSELVEEIRCDNRQYCQTRRDLCGSFHCRWSRL